MILKGYFSHLQLGKVVVTRLVAHFARIQDFYSGRYLTDFKHLNSPTEANGMIYVLNIRYILKLLAE